eukprot:365630-Chlamydomonas_euryale.AAC.32
MHKPGAGNNARPVRGLAIQGSANFHDDAGSQHAGLLATTFTTPVPTTCVCSTPACDRARLPCVQLPT